MDWKLIGGVWQAIARKIRFPHSHFVMPSSNSSPVYTVNKIKINNLTPGQSIAVAPDQTLISQDDPRFIDLTKQVFLSTIPWSPLTLANGWTNFGTPFATAAYRKHSTGIIELKGLIKKTGSLSVNETIAVLPPSCTPLENRIIASVSTVDTASVQLGVVGLYANSNLAYIAGSSGYFSLEHLWCSEADTGVFFGDSITFGFGLSNNNQRWSFFVSTALGIKEDNQGYSGSPLQNSGASGSTNAGIINNGFDTYNTRVLNRFGDKIFIVYGTNDIFDTLQGASVDIFKSQYQQILTSLSNANIKPRSITLGSPPYISPSVYANPAYNCNLQKHQLYIQAVKDLAKKNKVKYADLYSPMLNGGGDSLLQSDGIHPTAKGHQVIANAILNSTLVS